MIKQRLYPVFKHQHHCSRWPERMVWLWGQNPGYVNCKQRKWDHLWRKSRAESGTRTRGGVPALFIRSSEWWHHLQPMGASSWSDDVMWAQSDEGCVDHCSGLLRACTWTAVPLSSSSAPPFIDLLILFCSILMIFNVQLTRPARIREGFLMVKANVCGA